MQDIFENYNQENNKRVLKKLYNHNLGLGELLCYYNYLVDIDGNNIGVLFYVHRDSKKIFPWVTRKDITAQGEIYKIENIINHKIYIGESKDIIARKNKHSYSLYTGNHSNSDMQMDFYLYKMKSFTFEIIEQVKYPTKLVNREKYWIKEYNSEFPNGYNTPPKRKELNYNNRISLSFLEDYTYLAKTQQQKDLLIKSMIEEKYIPKYSYKESDYQ